MVPSTLEIDAVSKRFGDHLALDAVSLSVRAGEFVSILGPSGCGKSTLLRVIAGLEDQDAGEIRIGSMPMNAVSPKDRGTAFVFQSFALYPHLSCYGNIAAPLVMREMGFFERLPGVKKAVPAVRSKALSIDERVRAIARLLQIESLLGRKPSQLSGGQRQRVALGRALVRQPRLFLLDEPFANLDAALRNHTRVELTALQKRLGTTTIFVTHDQSEALAMSDRVAIMFGGAFRQVGTPEELYRNPADLEVARFLSQPYLNCIPARVIVAGWVLLGGLHMALADALEPGEEGIVGFRPEHCALAEEHGREGLAGIVERAEHAGADGHVFVRLNAVKEMCVVRVASELLCRWSPGARCSVKLDPRAAWFFPRQPAAATAVRSRDGRAA